MKTVCLDSTFLITYLRGKQGVKTTYNQLKAEGYSFYTTTINVFELFYGYFAAFQDVGSKSHEFTKIKNILSLLSIVSLTTNAAIRASSLRFQLQAQGIDIGVNDTFIAAIVLENGGNLITNNK